MNKKVSLYDEVVKVFKQDKIESSFSLDIDLENLLNYYEKIVKPDFLFLMDMRDPEARIVYEKNYRLVNTDGVYDINLESILKSLTKEDFNTLIEIDSISAVFTKQYFKKPFEYLMHVGMPVELVKGKKQFLLRTGTVLSFDKNGIPHYALGYFNDVTRIANGNNSLSYYISSTDLEPNEILELDKKFEDLLQSKSKLTLREHEILNEVAKGLTSTEISKNLHISKSTVDTHRQNMIKKYEVSNILELIGKL